MKETREFPYVTVSRKAEAALREKNPWVYAEEIRERSADFENGSLVDVLSDKMSAGALYQFVTYTSLLFQYISWMNRLPVILTILHLVIKHLSLY